MRGFVLDENIPRFIWYSFRFFLIINCFVLYYNPHDGRLAALVLYGVFCAIALVHIQFFTKDSGSKTGRILLCCQFLLSLLIQCIDSTQFSGFYHMINVAVAIMTYPAAFSAPFAAIVILSSTLLQFHISAASNWAEFWQIFGTTFNNRMAVVLFIAVARQSVATGAENKKLASALQLKNVELESALERLTHNIAEIKKNADLKARDHLMHELHDKLGHLLTTASISVQAASVLMDKNVTDAQYRLSIAAQQIQSAMQSLRDVISGREASASTSGEQFFQNLLVLFRETEKVAGISVNHNLQTQDPVAYADLTEKMQAFIYNSAMEGLTNGIKHGLSTRFHFELTRTPSHLCFCLRDDGRGFSSLDPGYGISKMRASALELDAQIDFHGKNGCTIDCKIPFAEKGECL